MMKKDIIAELKKEPKNKKHLVITGLVAFISTLLPWISVSFFGQTVSSNAWSGMGYLTVIGSLALVLNWLLPVLGIKYELPFKECLFNKIAAIMILAGPLILLYQVRFEMSFIGFGLWIGLAAGVYSTLLAFKK